MLLFSLLIGSASADYYGHSLSDCAGFDYLGVSGPSAYTSPQNAQIGNALYFKLSGTATQYMKYPTAYLSTHPGFSGSYSLCNDISCAVSSGDSWEVANYGTVHAWM